MILHRDLKEFVELLNDKQVDFVIIGAHALAFYGHPRFTGDLDILIQPTAENTGRLIDALNAFGFASLGLRASDFLVSGDTVQLGVPPNRIDILNAISGVPLESVWEGRVAGILDGIPVFFIGRAQYIENKRSVGRGKDKADIEALGEK
ncbi:MAG: hypothetical protein SGI88_08755 [Candidatus Hydrogenedentes bacterium]|nr:hypothetical protein [Candidatus Hydrogenedentota bacterium]